MDNLIKLFKETFEYNDGKLYWKKTLGPRAKKGNLAGKLRKDGYREVGMFGKYYLEHRVVYAIFNNTIPDLLDHIDRNRSNNRIDNLRVATFSQNSWNSRTPNNNKTGVKGVRKLKNGKFEARLAIKGKTIQVGTFSTLEEATLAIQNVRNSNHIQYACHG